MSDTDENRLTHSFPAISVIPEFYDCKYIIYVEGPEDIPFWNEIFKIKNHRADDYKVMRLGGKSILQVYIDGVITNKIKNTIIACDRDYENYMEIKQYNHPLVIKTYGYSIENSMYCPYSIAACIQKLSHICNFKVGNVNNWYGEFCNSALKLLPYDILNCIDEIGITCYGDNCSRFLTNGNSPYLDDKKIDDYIEQIKTKFDEDKIAKIKKKIKNDNKDIRYIIKGHFLTNAVLNFITHKVKEITKEKISYSKDALYSELVECQYKCGDSCSDRKYLYDSIKRALNFLRHNSIP